MPQESTAAPLSDTASARSSRSNTRRNIPSEPPEAPHAPAAESGLVLRAMRWWLSGLSSPLAILFLAAIVTAVFLNRGAIRIIPFEGSDGPRLTMQLAVALDDIAKGAESEINMDLTLRSAAELPDMPIPGTAISIATIVRWFQLGPLAVTEIRGVLQGQPGSYRLWLEIDGRSTPKLALQTASMATEDEAITAGAELLYSALQPIGAAYYLFRRDPDRSLVLVDRVLHDGNANRSDKSAAHRLWGLLLSDRENYDDARDQLAQALAIAADGSAKARIRVDTGYTYTFEQRWDEAATAFDLAAAADPSWAVPLTLRADALRELEHYDEAARLYHAAISRNDTLADPWIGLGLLEKKRGAYGDAATALVHARRLTSSPDQQAKIALEFGALFADVGCPREAMLARDQAVAFSAVRGAERGDWKQAGACLLAPATDDQTAATCCA